MSEVVDRMVAAFNRGDLEGFASAYADDVVVEDARGAVLVRGRDELRAHYGGMFDAAPQVHCEIVSRIAIGDYVVDEELVTGRAPEPERLVVVYHLRDGLVDHERIVR